MDRVSRADVEVAFRRAETAARAVGLDTHSWYLMPGSRANGRTWRLFSRPGGGDAVTGLDRGFIGTTARGAVDTLNALAAAWETVAKHQGTDRSDRSLLSKILLGELGETNSG